MPQFITSDGLSLSFDDTGGAGPAVLCLAGLTRNASDFDYAMPALKGARVIRMDYRGRGQSQWAENPMTYTIPREAQDALELLDHLSLPRAAILGTSRGGLIALTIAALAPQRLSGVCFNDIGPVIELGGLETIVDYIGRNPVWKTYDEAETAFATRVPGFYNVPAGRWREEVEKHYVQTDQGLTINYDPKLRDAVLASIDPNATPPDLWPLFSSLSALPLAALRGDTSDILSAETFAKMQECAPMIAATVQNRGHVPFLDEPESVHVLTRWVAELRKDMP
ncbi:alpha/beta fold hydrolase [Shimia abyssi]|uniref:Pimeloyl-ACP methyl ester carboxylesterase n=1 Tax=Shimia abyssi TaxID=1662395 RepID=A0A2P8FE33_9RHOB|nr:alpha/beta hydrolase [Shimia abyssi]PSL19990.1 pimeloyl-ACP methyl ester carboxylesterase [Shimia abyssi]